METVCTMTDLADCARSTSSICFISWMRRERGSAYCLQNDYNESSELRGRHSKIRRRGGEEMLCRRIIPRDNLQVQRQRATFLNRQKRCRRYWSLEKRAYK